MLTRIENLFISLILLFRNVLKIALTLDWLLYRFIQLLFETLTQLENTIESILFQVFCMFIKVFPLLNQSFIIIINQLMTNRIQNIFHKHSLFLNSFRTSPHYENTFNHKFYKSISTDSIQLDSQSLILNDSE